jgi:hypothetical protein
MPNPKKTDEALSLDEIVRNVAAQLHALRDNPPPDPVIQFAGCEIELSVKATVQAGGGIKFYVFSAEAKAGTEQVSKIKLKFGSAGAPVILQATTPGEAPEHKRQS